MIPRPEKSQAWHRQRKLPIQIPFWAKYSLIGSTMAGAFSEEKSESSVGDWTVLAMTMRMTKRKEVSIAMSSKGLTRSLLMRKPRIADHRGFVWKMMIIKVMGIRCKLNVNSKKPVVPNKARV